MKHEDIDKQLTNLVQQLEDRALSDDDISQIEKKINLLMKLKGQIPK